MVDPLVHAPRFAVRFFLPIDFSAETPEDIKNQPEDDEVPVEEPLPRREHQRGDHEREPSDPWMVDGTVVDGLPHADRG